MVAREASGEAPPFDIDACIADYLRRNMNPR
ncbi:hypothetical protein [Clavibacter nebraskensis]